MLPTTPGRRPSCRYAGVRVVDFPTRATSTRSSEHLGSVTRRDDLRKSSEVVDARGSGRARQQRHPVGAQGTECRLVEPTPRAARRARLGV